MILAALVACTGEAPSSGAGDAVSRVAAFRSGLEARGHVVEPLATSQSFLSVDTEWWCVSQIPVGVHAYTNDAAMTADVRHLKAPGTFASIDFAAAPHFYAHDRLIVEAVGVHDQIAPDLVELLAPKLGVSAFGFNPTIACDEFRRLIP